MYLTSKYIVRVVGMLVVLVSKEHTGKVLLYLLGSKFQGKEMRINTRRKI